MARGSHSARMRCAAAAPMALRRLGGQARARRRASAKPAGLPWGAIQPDSPSTTISRMPPWGETMTGRPLAMASMQL